jgi:hypothetical protein
MQAAGNGSELLPFVGVDKQHWTRPLTEAALLRLRPVRHYLFDFASELSKMGGEALVKLALPRSVALLAICSA